MNEKKVIEYYRVSESIDENIMYNLRDASRGIFENWSHGHDLNMSELNLLIEAATLIRDTATHTKIKKNVE